MMPFPNRWRVQNDSGSAVSEAGLVALRQDCQGPHCAHLDSAESRRYPSRRDLVDDSTGAKE
jgi:hypothetical protein